MTDSTKHTVKIILCCIAIFATGAITGGIVTAKLLQHMIAQRNNPTQLSAFWMKALDSKLKLSPEQSSHIKPMLDQTAQRVHRSIDAYNSEFHEALNEVQAEIEPQLNPEQLKVFREIMRKRHEGYRKFMGEDAVSGKSSPVPVGPEGATDVNR